jgi:hypothetical protein
MFIDHTILFGCMAWWVRTRVLTVTATYAKTPLNITLQRDALI